MFSFLLDMAAKFLYLKAIHPTTRCLHGHIYIKKINKPLASLFFILGARNLNKAKSLSGVSKLLQILFVVCGRVSIQRQHRGRPIVKCETSKHQSNVEASRI